MKTRILVILLIVFALAVDAQQIKPLSVGDKVPDVFFKKMLNHTAGSGNLSDFKGKAIIVDMWFRECGSCVEAMAHLDSVQKAYKDELQVLLVTWQDEAKIKDFWKIRLPVQGLKFTQAVEDTIMRTLFPAAGFPHQIWIDKNGIVKSINDGTKTTKENIGKLITGAKIDISVKQDELDPLVSNAVLPMVGITFKENRNKILHYSYLSNHRPEFGGKSFLEMPEDGIIRVRFLNLDYITLYHNAYAGNADTPFDHKHRLVRADSNPLKHEPDFKTFSNVFCYDLIFRGDSTYKFSKYMIGDLDRYLGFKSYEEIRKIKTLVIRPNGKGIAYKKKLNPDRRALIESNKFTNGKLVMVNNGYLPILNQSVMTYSAVPTIFDFPSNITFLNFKLTWNTEDPGISLLTFE